MVIEFTRRFEQAWAATPPEYREKAAVVEWLEARLIEAEAGVLDVAPPQTRAGDQRMLPA